MRKINISLCPKIPSHAVSKTLYGIFLEDINYAVDGGFNANRVNNYSFDGVYLSKDKNQAVEDSLRYWQVSSGRLESCSDGGLSSNSKIARIYAD